jgi:2-keto-4-pentenoate hydratase/2-oxohepta-3-ene-1,7-dioic acid hydratase in catechol pathway
MGPIAGLTVGQDISNRHLQCAADGQFSLGKSRQAYGPMGMWVVTPDVLADLDDLVIGCAADGEKTQDPTPATSSSVSSFSASLVAEVSGVFPLLPGDLGFTGSLRGRHNSASHRAFSRPAARSLNPGSRASVRSATVAVEPHAVADTPRPSPRWELSIPTLDGETACHNQPTRRKFQRSRSTAMIMMRIASG